MAEAASRDLARFAKNIDFTDGTSIAALRLWLERVETAAAFVTAPVAEFRQFCAYISSGPLLRKIKEFPLNEEATVNGLITEIKRALLNEDDLRIRRTTLDGFKRPPPPYQDVRESSLIFSERVGTLYTTEDLAGPITIPRMIQSYVNGLRDPYLQWHVYNSRPEAMEEAIIAANRAATTADLMAAERHVPPGVPRQEEPMDISLLAPPSSIHNGPLPDLPPPPADMLQGLESSTTQTMDTKISQAVSEQLRGLQSQIGKLERRLQGSTHSKPSATRTARPAPDATRKPRHAPDGRPICVYCSKAGHYARECIDEGAATTVGKWPVACADGRVTITLDVGCPLNTLTLNISDINASVLISKGLIWSLLKSKHNTTTPPPPPLLDNHMQVLSVTYSLASVSAMYTCSVVAISP